ncbi:MAG TPA: FAD binding domain-containing protein [Candidatus Limnocylindria bacterium]|nr:FAD binding domain-containing protein [Candidatus Limnocylindria bacterium]
MAAVRRPLSLGEALRILADGPMDVLAGGTDLMPRRARAPGPARPALCVGHLGELRHVGMAGDELRIGAACTLTELLDSPLLPPFLKQPLAGMAAPAIRNAATIGGNVCNASPAGDALPMLYALDAVLLLQSARGERLVPVRDFITGPGKTTLGAGELLAEIRVPLGREWRFAYHKVGTRRANSLAKLSLYALWDGDRGNLMDVRVALGAVAPTVVRSREAEEEALRGVRQGGEGFAAGVLARYGALITPIDDARSSRAYRRAVTLRLLERFLKEEMGT